MPLIFLAALLLAASVTSTGEWLACPVRVESRTRDHKRFSPDIPKELREWRGNVEKDAKGIPVAYYIFTNLAVRDPAPCSRSTSQEARNAVGGTFDPTAIENLPTRSPARESLYKLWHFFQPALAWATTVTEAFTGNEDPLSSAGAWSAYAALNELAKVSNVGRCNAVNGTDCYQTRTDYSGAAVYAQILIVTFNNTSGANYACVNLRFTAPETRQGYQLCARESSSLASMIIHVDGDVYTTIASNVTDWGATDTLQARANGTTLEIFRNGALNLSGSDASYTTGRVGAGVYIDALAALSEVEIDNFAGGDLADLTPAGGGRRPPIFIQ